MNIVMVNEKTGQEKTVKFGLNYNLMLTSPFFGITLFKKGFTKLGVAMLITILIFIFNILFFSIFTSTFATYFSNTSGIQENSALMQLYYMLDLDYSDILENFFFVFALSFLTIIGLSVFSGAIANRMYAKIYLDDGYKFLVDSADDKSKIKTVWHFKEENFV